MKTIILISANAEWDAVKSLFPDARIEQFPYGESFNASIGNHSPGWFHSGWGKIASAAAMQYVIDRHSPDLIVNLGNLRRI
jgi:nucleoside phosphorylase